MVYDVSKFGTHDEVTVERSELGLGALLDLRGEWVAHWTPSLPRDDTLTPLMMALLSMQPVLPPVVVPRGSRFHPRTPWERYERSSILWYIPFVDFCGVRGVSFGEGLSVIMPPKEIIEDKPTSLLDGLCCGFACWRARLRGRARRTQPSPGPVAQAPWAIPLSPVEASRNSYSISQWL